MVWPGTYNLRQCSQQSSYAEICSHQRPLSLSPSPFCVRAGEERECCANPAELENASDIMSTKCMSSGLSCCSSIIICPCLCNCHALAMLLLLVLSAPSPITATYIWRRRCARERQPEAHPHRPSHARPHNRGENLPTELPMNVA